MKQYHDILETILTEGVETTDRTGTGTISHFGTQSRYDMADGFPLVTTKKLHIKSIIHELLWFLRGDTNNNSLKDVGVKIWDEWAGECGSLGPIYGAAWRYAPSHDVDNMVQVRIREDIHAGFQEPEVVWHDKIECDLNTDGMWAIAEEGGKNTVYTFQTKNGYVGKTTRPNWKASNSWEKFDRFRKTIASVGFLGNPIDCDEKLYNMWSNMILRCYDRNHPSYPAYGGSGVTVSPIWHSFERFVRSVSSVPFFHLWLKKPGSVDIDKDYFGSKVYSPSTCIFIDGRINKAMRSESALMIGGRMYANWAHFEKLSGVRSDYLKKRLSMGFSCKGYTPDMVREVRAAEGFVWRQQIFLDQIERLVEDIRKTPDSRRLIVSGWNPAELENMALPPCHTMWQVKILGGKLHLQLYQRSGDMFLGVPFNIASYALLLHMLAHVTGYEPGTFVHTMGDAHIYSNHVDQVKLQLTREPLPLPKLVINRKVDSIFDFKFEDFTIEGYEAHPHIAGAVAV